MEGRKAEIEVYSIGASVELWQDGRLLGKKKLQEYKADFKIVYRKGMLRAVSFDENGKKIEESILKSAEKETILSIHPEKEGENYKKEELIYFEIELTDRNGIRKLLTDRRVKVEVSGAGILAGLCSSNPFTTDSFIGSEYDTYQGKLLAVVRNNGTTGKVTIKAVAGTLMAESGAYYEEE